MFNHGLHNWVYSSAVSLKILTTIFDKETFENQGGGWSFVQFEVDLSAAFLRPFCFCFSIIMYIFSS